VRSLIDPLKDEEAVVRAGAVWALTNITVKEFNQNPEEW